MCGHRATGHISGTRPVTLVSRVEERDETGLEAGRGWYGVRRVASDQAEDVEHDERVLNSITGHPDSTTRRLVYQDRDRPEVLKKAAITRTKVRRGESERAGCGRCRRRGEARERAAERLACVPHCVPQRKSAAIARTTAL